jgi:acylphosphatase
MTPAGEPAVPDEQAVTTGGEAAPSARAASPAAQAASPAARARSPRGQAATPSGQPATPSRQARLTAWIEGRVQGVGFRWWARARALELGLSGFAENLEDGRVRVIAEGPAESCRELLALLSGGETPGRVVRVTHRWDDPRGGLSGFAER